MLFTVVSKPSSQWFCLVQPPKHSCLKSVPKHEWKKSSHTQSSFPKGSNCSLFSNLFLCFLGFCFPSGHDTFSVLIGHLFPISWAELKRYLSCNSCVPTQRCNYFSSGIALQSLLLKVAGFTFWLRCTFYGLKIVWASAVCTRVNGNPAPVIRFMQFHYCTASSPGTGADDAFVLKRGMYTS